jgi:hypothetical protein
MAAMRPMVSAELPGAFGIISRIVRLGYSFATSAAPVTVTGHTKAAMSAADNMIPTLIVPSEFKIFWTGSRK